MNYYYSTIIFLQISCDSNEGKKGFGSSKSTIISTKDSKFNKQKLMINKLTKERYANSFIQSEENTIEMVENVSVSVKINQNVDIFEYDVENIINDDKVNINIDQANVNDNKDNESDGKNNENTNNNGNEIDYENHNKNKNNDNPNNKDNENENHNNKVNENENKPNENQNNQVNENEGKANEYLNQINKIDDTNNITDNNKNTNDNITDKII